MCDAPGNAMNIEAVSREALAEPSLLVEAAAVANTTTLAHHVHNTTDKISIVNDNLVCETNDDNDIMDPIHEILNSIKVKHPKNLVICHVNINSIRNKFDNIVDILLKGYIDCLAISETKLDGSFPMKQFTVEGFTCIRADSTSKSGGIMVLLRNDIPHRRRTDLELDMYNIQSLVVECHIRGEKWFIITLYKLPKIRNNDFIDFMSQMYDRILSEASEVICMGDFNIDMLVSNPISSEICNIYGVTNVIDKPTCFKSSQGTLIDPVLVTNKGRVATSINVTCGFSDWHNIVGCVTKIHMPRQHPTRIFYRSYKKFDDEQFCRDISYIPFHVCTIFDDIDDQYDMYTKLLTDVVDEHAPIKTKILKKKQAPFMNSRLRKEMHYRNKLKNIYFKYRTGVSWNAYKRQRNKVASIRRESIKKKVF